MIIWVTVNPNASLSGQIFLALPLKNCLRGPWNVSNSDTRALNRKLIYLEISAQRPFSHAGF